MKRSEAFVFRNIYDKHVLMPVLKNDLSDMPIVLNEVAAAIWCRVEECSNKEMLIEEICNLYNLKKESPEKEAIESFVKRLIDFKLIME